MRRTRRMQDGVQVCLRLPQADLERLRQLARRRAMETQCDVLYTDIIRELVRNHAGKIDEKLDSLAGPDAACR